MAWLSVHHPRLISRCQAMYADGCYAPNWCKCRITRQVHELAAEYGVGPARSGEHRRVKEPRSSGQPAAEQPATQLTLL
jgi:hypothetical protein